MRSRPPFDFVPSLREQIVDRLRAEVVSGRLAEGESLTEQELSDRFAVSRTPIREALQQLTHEGLLVGRRNAGVRVAQRPSAAISDFAVSIRRSVETFALRSFFADIDDEDLRHWNEILECLREACAARDYRAIAEHDIAFHRSIIRRAHQQELEAIWVPLLSRVRMHFRETQRANYPDPMAIHQEHVDILNVFRSGDLEASVRALEKNIC
jgi:DNA-binding GntR family transcriptional regulator